MIEIKRTDVERAILVSLNTREFSKEIVEEHLDELEMLADTAGAQTVMKIIQDRDRRDAAYYLGKGKAEEVAQLVEMNEIDLVIFDDDLNPVQLRNLEKLINKKIIDRSGLILDIFASRAKTKEAKTQVELAQLQYMLPRLTRAWTHLSKQYGGIGTKGPGETQIETDRRLIRNRISLLKEKLKKIEAQRITQSSQRKNMLRVSLVGYTNAGKSTLLNLLTSAGVLAENKLFATLDSTTRVLELENGKKILLSDTVGFIRKLPHHLVASFKSTLDEVREADILLHVIDFSHQFFEEQISVVEQTLKELKCDNKQQFRIFNKVDNIEDKSLVEYVMNKYDNPICLSAARGINVSKLMETLVRLSEETFAEETLELAITESRLVAMIHQLAEVLNVNYEEDKIVISYRTDQINNNKIKRMLNEKTGTAHRR